MTERLTTIQYSADIPEGVLLPKVRRPGTDFDRLIKVADGVMYLGRKSASISNSQQATPKAHINAT